MPSLWTLAGLVACTTQEPAPEPTPKARPNVVLITTDTTRADRLGAYGYEKAITPHIDGLAARGRRYERAYSPLPQTIPAHATLFTGRNPPTHGVRQNGSEKLDDSETTLAEIFRRNGYQTAGSVSAFVTHRRFGFDQGFDAYYDEIRSEEQNFWRTKRSAGEVVDDLLEWKTTAPKTKPIFMWAHLYDPHLPYTPPDEWRAKAPDRPYDAEVAYMDSEIGRLMDAFDPENTIFIIVSDHGEGLGDHGESTHGLYLYDSTQRVPWIMAGPGIETEVVEETVGLVDVAPTLVDLVGFGAMSNIDGRVAPGTEPKPVYMEAYQIARRFKLAPHVGVVADGHKLIDVPRPELYAVPSEESDNIASSDASRLATLQRALADFGYDPPTDQQTQMDGDVAAELQALGYLEGGAMPELTDLEDPKDYAEMLEGVQRADLFALTNQPDKVRPIIEELASKYPAVVEFKTRLAHLMTQSGENEQAMKLVREALELDPNNSELLQGKAVLLSRMGRHTEAAALYLELTERFPHSDRFRTMAFHTLIESKDEKRALQYADRKLAQNPNDIPLSTMVGLYLAKQGQLQGARPLLEVAGTAPNPARGVRSNLAVFAFQDKDPGRGIELLKQEVAAYPKNYAAQMTLLTALGRLGGWEELATASETTLQTFPKSPEANYWRAQALFNLKKHGECRTALDAGLAVAPTFPRLIMLDANLLVIEGKRDEAEKRKDEAQAAMERARTKRPKK